MGDEKNVMGIPQLVLSNTLLINGALFLGLVGIHTGIDKSQLDSVPVSITLLILAMALLIKSADFFIEGAKGLAYRAGLPEVVIGLTIVSIGTSLPEILVTTTSAADMRFRAADPTFADFALGGIFGSILVQITFILGVVVTFRGVKIRPSWLKRDGVIMLGSILLLTFFLKTGGVLSSLEGLILVSLYAAYIYWLLSNREEIMREEMTEEKAIERVSNWTTASYIAMVTLGLLLALFAAHHLVEIASDMAVRLEVPHAVVGTTVSGLGTSLPELTIAFMAAKRSEGVAIGALIGSNITDPLLSVGLAAMVFPLSLTPEGTPLTMNLIIPATILGTMVALGMMRSQYEFKRWEGIVLIFFYLIFLGLLVAQRQGILVL
ncbi:MAG: sodium:calcium antiporter [Candidatus Poseidonia sp.]|uniref:sodium:calcium antiporter n=1 Tax=Poseidonia sp. TaxID=2666344 RepID=UPI0030C05AA8|nr:sodium:calcium antiporter [Poseidonia sp.]MDG1552228.1 sodium:calcium antiporter [Poseidonia sp.]